MKKIKTFSIAITMLICLASFGQEKSNDTIKMGCRKVSYRMASNKFPKPLYILNDFETSEKIIRNLNPNNIVSINILKGEAATVLYGQKAMNGVIVITTKNLSRKELKKLKKESIAEFNNDQNLIRSGEQIEKVENN